MDCACRPPSRSTAFTGLSGFRSRSSCRSSSARFSSRRLRTRSLAIRDELEQAAVRVAEVDAGAATAGRRRCPSAPTRPSTPWPSRCATASSIGPAQTKQRSLLPGWTGSRPTRLPTSTPGPCTFSCCVADAIREPAGADVEDLGADDVTVERVRRLPVGDRDHAVVETQGPAHDPDDRARERPFRA